MQMKSLAIVAATVMTVGAAQAADLNKPAKVAVDYVKVCDAYGAGFFYIPGSDTCLKISGFARLDVLTGGQSSNRAFITSGLNRSGDRTSSSFADNVRADVQIDARTNTQFGLLRSFEDFHFNQSSSAGNSSVVKIELDHAFVQWGGLTAGRTTSKTNFGDGEQGNQEYLIEGFLDNSVNLIAYTFAFGNGVTGTVSIEDPSTAGYQTTASAVAAGSSNSAVRLNGATTKYGAVSTPDIVGQLNVTQAWGEAQLSGVLHQDYFAVANGGLSNASKYGYAFNAGILFNLPMIGAGDTIAFNAGWGRGAGGYVQSVNYVGGDVGADAVWTGTQTKLSTAWEVGAVFVHNFTPQVAFEFDPVYYSWEDNGMRHNQTQLSASIAWKPVKGLLIKPDIEYNYSSLNNAAKLNSGAVNGSAYVFGVRIQRSF